MAHSVLMPNHFAQRAAARSAAGLVPSITSGNGAFLVNFDKGAVAERRVNRLKRSVWASGHLHGIANDGFRAPVPWFVTLTYAKEDAWAARHISDAIAAYRRWCKSMKVPCRYTWVAEIQPKRAAATGKEVVHYHLLAWLPAGVPMRQWDRSYRRCAPFWVHGMTNTQVSTAGVGYLMKYLSKLGEFTNFPKGLRLYGIGGLDEKARAIRNWFNLPSWAKLSFGVGDLVRKSGCLVVFATGEILNSPYTVQRLSGALLVRASRPLPARFHDGVYSTFPRPRANA